MARGSKDYEVVIPVRIRNTTQSGAKEVHSAVDKMLRDEMKAIEDANRAVARAERKALQDSLRENEKASQREIAVNKARTREAEREAEKRRKSEEREVRATTRTLEREERQRVNASIALQKQRSAALIAIWRQEQRERERISRQEAQTAARPGIGFGGAAIAGAVGGAAVLVGREVINDLQQGAKAWLDYASRIQNAKIAFTAMLGSSQAAMTHLKELQQFAIETPFQFADLVDASQRMQALGFAAKEVVPWLRDIGNAVSAAGGGQDRLERVIKAMSDVRAKEKLLSVEVRQFAEAGISVYKILQEETGKTTGEIIKMMEAGEISAEMFFTAFRRFSQAHFGDLMEKQAQTFLGAMSNIQDVLLQISAKAFEPFFNRISEIAYRLQQELQKAKDLGDVVNVLSDAFAELGGLLAERLVMGMGAALSKPATYEFLIKNFTGLFFVRLYKGFSDEIKRGRDEALIQQALQQMREGRQIDLGWTSESIANKVKLEAINRHIIETTNKIIEGLKGETDAARAQSAAFKELQERIKAYRDVASKPTEAKFEILPERLQDRATTLAKSVMQDADTIRATMGRFGDYQLAFERAVLARKDEISSFAKQVKETMSTLAGPGGAKKAYDDFIASLNQPGLQAALSWTKQFESNLKGVEEAEKGALEGQRKHAEEVKSISDTLTQRLAAITEQRAQLNAEVGKAPDAMREYDMWWAKISEREKSLIQSTPHLTSAIEQLKKETQEFSQDQASAGIADILRDVETEMGRYVDGAREADTASEKLRARFEASGLAARGTADEVAALIARLDELEKKEQKAAEDKKRREAEDLQRDTTRGIQGLEIGLDRVISGRDETRVESLINSLVGLKGLGIPENALRPFSDFVRVVAENPEGLAVGENSVFKLIKSLNLVANTDAIAVSNNADALRSIVRTVVKMAEGVDPSQVDKITNAIVKLLTTTAHLDTPQGRAELRLQDQTKSLQLELEDSQQAIALAAEGAAMRYQIAWQNAINEVTLADQSARESQIVSQVRIADASVLHTEQVRARVLDHLASQTTITEAWGDTIVGVYDKVGGVVDKAIGKLTHGLGIVDDLLKSIAHQLLNRLFQKFLDAVFPPTGGSATGSAQKQAGGGGGSWVQKILGSFGVGSGGATGTPPFAGGFSAAGFLPTPGSVSAPNIDEILKRGLNIGVGDTSKLGQQTMMGSAKQGIAALLPFLGLSAGVAAGGQSRFGSVLGGAGGLALGAAGAAFLLPSMFATTGIFGTMGPAIAGLLTNPFTIAIAGGLIVTALILGKKAQRDKDEKTRAAAQSDTGSALFAILNAVRNDSMDGATARAEIEKLHQNWIQVGNSLKDSKTRRIHMETWTHFQPIIDGIEKEIGQQTTRANNRNRMVPVFASGGFSQKSQLIKVRPGEGIQYPGMDTVSSIPGRDLGYDSQYMYVPRGTQIIPNSDMRTAHHMSSGGVAGGSPLLTPSTLTIESISVSIDEDGIATAVIKSSQFDDAVVKSVRVGRTKKRI